MSDTELLVKPKPEPEAEPVRRLEVFTGAGRRRRWSSEQKARIISERCSVFYPGPGVPAPSKQLLRGQSVPAGNRRHPFSALISGYAPRRSAAGFDWSRI
jgi:hypothetical protein